MKLTISHIAIAASIVLGGLAAGASTSMAQTPKTVVWAVQSGQSKTYEAAVDRWNKNHPDKQIDLQIFANDPYKEKIRLALGAGQGPALMFSWGGGVLRTYVESGYVDPIADPAINDRYIDVVRANVTFNGKTYAAGINNMAPVVLLYNKTVFEKAAVAVPATWSDLLKTIDVFKSKGILPFALAGQTKWPELPYLSYLVDRIGGPEVFDAVVLNKANSWSHPAIIDALGRIQSLVKAGAFGQNFASIAYETGAADALLYTGRAAMMLQLAGSYTNIKNTVPDFVASGALGFAPFPAVEGGVGDPTDITGNPSNYWAVTSATPQANKAVAVAFLREEVMSDQWITEILMRSAVPGVKSAQAKIAQMGNDGFLSFVLGLAEKSKHFQLSWDEALTPVQGAALRTNLDRVFLLEIDPQEFARVMNGTLQKP
jgi:raffinose/stachyose/melibiose transport system substrate-binding protein